MNAFSHRKNYFGGRKNFLWQEKITFVTEIIFFTARGIDQVKEKILFGIRGTDRVTK